MNSNDVPHNNATRLYLVRHGESLDNAGVPHPRTPEGSPLTERGRAQAHDVARRLAQVPATAVIASDLLRAGQTAEIIAHARGLEVRIVPNLHERSIGSFGGKPNLEGAEEYREQFAAYERGSNAEKMRWKLGDDWESLEEARLRFTGALEGVAREYRGRTVIVVAHGTVMRAFLIGAGYGSLDELQEGAVDNTGYIVMDWTDGGWTIQSTDAVTRTAAGLQRSGEEA